MLFNGDTGIAYQRHAAPKDQTAGCHGRGAHIPTSGLPGGPPAPRPRPPPPQGVSGAQSSPGQPPWSPSCPLPGLTAAGQASFSFPLSRCLPCSPFSVPAPRPRFSPPPPPSPVTSQSATHHLLPHKATLNLEHDYQSFTHPTACAPPAVPRVPAELTSKVTPPGRRPQVSVPKGCRFQPPPPPPAGPPVAPWQPSASPPTFPHPSLTLGSWEICRCQLLQPREHPQQLQPGNSSSGSFKLTPRETPIHPPSRAWLLVPRHLPHGQSAGPPPRLSPNFVQRPLPCSSHTCAPGLQTPPQLTQHPFQHPGPTRHMTLDPPQLSTLPAPSGADPVSSPVNPGPLPR